MVKKIGKFILIVIYLGLVIALIYLGALVFFSPTWGLN